MTSPSIFPTVTVPRHEFTPNQARDILALRLERVEIDGPLMILASLGDRDAVAVGNSYWRQALADLERPEGLDPHRLAGAQLIVAYVERLELGEPGLQTVVDVARVAPGRLR